MSIETHVDARSLIQLKDGKRIIISDRPLGSENLIAAVSVRNGKLFVDGEYVRELLPEELPPEKTRTLLDSLLLPELEG
ncbi:MAG: hypothetical protein AAB458_00225 [Patescibacteria group bacterium]